MTDTSFTAILTDISGKLGRLEATSEDTQKDIQGMGAQLNSQTAQLVDVAHRVAVIESNLLSAEHRQWVKERYDKDQERATEKKQLRHALKDKMQGFALLPLSSGGGAMIVIVTRHFGIG